MYETVAWDVAIRGYPEGWFDFRFENTASSQPSEDGGRDVLIDAVKEDKDLFLRSRETF